MESKVEFLETIWIKRGEYLNLSATNLSLFGGWRSEFPRKVPRIKYPMRDSGPRHQLAIL